MKAHILALFALSKITISLFLLCTTAQAAEIYHSANDDGVPSTNVAITPDGSANVLHLYIAGSTASPTASPIDTACSGDQTATGTELCGWDIKIEALDGVQFISFNPALGVTHTLTTPNLLRANGGQPLTPSTAPEKIGDLTVSANSTGALEVSGTHYVSALLRLVEVPTIQVALATDDNDGDGVSDSADNCTEVSNANQLDTDNDGFGNICDADLDNSGLVNTADLSIFRSVFFTNDPDADLDGNGIVNAADLAIFRSLFFKPPGPSGTTP